MAALVANKYRRSLASPIRCTLYVVSSHSSIQHYRAGLTTKSDVSCPLLFLFFRSTTKTVRCATYATATTLQLKHEERNKPVSQVVQRQGHAQEVGHPRLERVVRVDEPNEIVGKRLRVRCERRELTFVATRGLRAQTVAVFLHDSDEVLPVQGRVLDLKFHVGIAKL